MTTRAAAGLSRIGSPGVLALLYVTIPNVVFLTGWIVRPLGLVAALVIVGCVGASIVRGRDDAARIGGASLGLVVAVAAVWCVWAGIGHFVYANSDWWVRDAVLLDLIRHDWPVRYRVDGVELVLRTPIGYYLPAAFVGKLAGLRAAEWALLAWSTVGVSLVFALMLRDRPRLRVACIRIGVFVLFSGADILPTLGRDYPHAIGSMIEWWGRFISYQSQTTSLFWAPNHTLTGWIAVAYLLSDDLAAIPIERFVLLVVLSAISAPLTAFGASLLGVALVAHRLWTTRSPTPLFDVFNARTLGPIVLVVAFLVPYLLAGSGRIDAGYMWQIPWIGEEYGARYTEFIVVEFLGFALVLLALRPRDPLLWTAIATLLVLPIFRFGPYNDLLMRGSVPALALLSIVLGRWLSAPRAETGHPRLRIVAITLLAIGAVTPLMEMSRPFIAAPWPMNTQRSLVDVTKGSHYLAPDDQPWIETFLRHSVNR